VRIVFFGTPDFAVPTLARLLEGPHDVVAVVSQPDRPRGRGRTVHPSPISKLALDAGVRLLRPEQVGEASVVEALRATAADLGVVVAFGQFLTRRVRELPSRGYLVNAHASLLPRHRGAAPIAHAILAGDSLTGISVMRVEREMDAGPVALVRRLAIGPEEDCGHLTQRLAALAADAIDQALDDIAADRATWQEQDPALATLAPKIDKRDAALHWSEPATALHARIRAMAPTPGARTRLAGETLSILEACVDASPTDREPGGVEVRSDGGLRIATGAGWLVPLRLQRAGGKRLDTAAFLRGRPIPDGARLGE